ncbi:MAG TPA: precorrin-8X methylmutase [Chthoniobacterales bacterium]|jgi:precorrin-8X/cobalt-precorrin-8 methylmutase|nr:precorrin-8X methylmutase [Chthoniobacterales bacterium]
MTTIPAYDIVIAGHGSRDPEGVIEFENLVRLVRARASGRRVTHGFLEFARPTISEAVRENIASGSERIAIVPGLLLAATHAKNDIPTEVRALQQAFPNIKLHYGSALHLHPLILRLFREKIIESEARSERLVRRSDSCLVIVGRGTTDPDANSEVSKLGRILEEGLGFGGSFICYSGTARPLIAEGLERAVRLGFQRIIVAPFFLFTGILVKRIYAAVDELASRRPETEFLKCDYLGTHDFLADAFLERAEEAFTGKSVASCSLCKYRVSIVGYEKDVGAPQRGHHSLESGLSKAVNESRTRIDSDGTKAHPIELESFKIIRAGRDWSSFPEPERDILQRLVHASGDFSVADEIFISPGAVAAGIAGLAGRARIITDVTMVQTGLRRTLLEAFGIEPCCFVHDEETRLLAQAAGLTRSAAGIRRAWMSFGNDLIIAIGDAPTAVEEAIRLVNVHQWRPHLIIGLPVGFVGTAESKERLRRCFRVPRITNRGTRGGSPWAAAVINALMIHFAKHEDELKIHA